MQLLRNNNAGAHPQRQAITGVSVICRPLKCDGLRRKG